MLKLSLGKKEKSTRPDAGDKKRCAEVKRAIERALRQSGFQVYYQPVYGIRENRIVAAEALLRMYDEELGWVGPEEFIPIAEQNGRIIEIGQLVLENVCEFLRDEDISQYGLRYIEVNLSVTECLQEELPQRIRELLERYEVSPEQLSLELRESTLARYHSDLGVNMHRIHDMGVGFVLDGYGTGHSTLTYMMTLPFRLVKVDKSILWTALKKERALIALNASINLIKDMNMEIVVEGVEAETMADRLMRLGCDYLQGFYYAKPLPKAEFLEYMARQIS